MTGSTFSFFPKRGSVHQMSGVSIFLLLYLGITTVTRIALLCRSAGSVSWDGSIVMGLLFGFAFDLGSGLLLVIPMVLFLAFLPVAVFRSRWFRVAAHVFFWCALVFIVFGAVSEWVFWDEFEARFNFIAVDYLIYTTEVVANIRESYPMPVILAGIAVVASLGLWILVRRNVLRAWLESDVMPAGRRWRCAAVWLVAATAAGVGLDIHQIPEWPNTYNRELAKDGLWSFVAAFRDNELDFRQFYSTIPTDEAESRVKAALAEDGSVSIPSEDGGFETLRYVANHGVEMHPNIIQITVESLSASYLGAYNPESDLTPQLDLLAEKSLVFDRLYATGTRTVRGMEALTLSLPPTPGRSIVKRPENGGMFTFGSVLETRGYDTSFLYGGNGYFDNMNAFFSGNGYRIVDRPRVSDEDVTFENAWGACDGDLFNWSIREADKIHATGRPFHQFIMTTSNHRPYTYPEGKIDLPPKVSRRRGTVKYTDYAIGQFIRDASTHAWFNDTIFVIIADHCHSSAGKTELPVDKYHIPLLIYAPGGQIAPGRVKELCSQIDVVPTLLGLLNWSYPTRFFGWDITGEHGTPRAFIGNYQKLGLLKDGMLSVLTPVLKHSLYRRDDETGEIRPADPDPDFLSETVAYYQTASDLYLQRRFGVLTEERLTGIQESFRPGADSDTIGTTEPDDEIPGEHR